MELIKSHNESVEGNEAIRKINKDRIQKEINRVHEAIAECYDRDEPLSAEDLEVEIEELESMLEDVEHGYLEYV